MSTNQKSIRDQYFDGEIFNVGDIVQVIESNEEVKIIDRGVNYVTVAIGEEVSKMWLDQIQVIVEEISEEKPKKLDFELSEAGTIVLFGYETRNFDRDLSETILEQFEEFDDLYSKHQIVKCLDYAIGNPNDDTAYELLSKVESFYDKKNLISPFIVEALKTDIERRRLAEIIAAVAEMRPSKSNYQTVSLAIKELKKKYQSRKQWEVLWPLFKLAAKSGMDGIMQSLPYTFGAPTDDEQDVKNEMEDNVIYSTMEENLDLMLEDMDDEDFLDTFAEEEMISEVLSIESRNKLSRKMAQHEPIIAARRTRALAKAASSDVLLARARRLAETLIKRRMFHKGATELTRQEKERFEKGSYSRRAVVAKLAQRLVGKVRALQSARLHGHTGSQPTSTTSTTSGTATHTAVGSS